MVQGSRAGCRYSSPMARVMVAIPCQSSFGSHRWSPDLPKEQRSTLVALGHLGMEEQAD
jgi:hypothetical protein